MILISALSENGVIGQGDALPWHLPEDYSQFLSFVAGQVVILGRRSYEIFGPDLTAKHILVLTRQPRSLPDAACFTNMDDAYRRAQQLNGVIFCAGGAQVYAAAMPLAQWLFLSHVKGHYRGDAHFPKIDQSQWQAVERRQHPTFDFVKYRREP